jgi:hypothetical protein
VKLHLHGIFIDDHWHGSHRCLAAPSAVVETRGGGGQRPCRRLKLQGRLAHQNCQARCRTWTRTVDGESVQRKSDMVWLQPDKAGHSRWRRMILFGYPSHSASGERCDILRLGTNYITIRSCASCIHRIFRVPIVFPSELALTGQI